MKTIPSFEEIVKKYPDLFIEEGQRTCPWGLECSKGWHPFIYEMIKQLHKINKNNETNNKYNPEFKYTPVKILQIKEKFGTLRCYILGDEMAYGVVTAYEHLSQYICEYCGTTKSDANVKVSGGGWLKCLCTSCRKKYEEGTRL
jgi:hypothetical protein